MSELQQTTIELKESVGNAELQFQMLDVLKPDIACNYLISTADDLWEQSNALATEVERYENSQKIDEAGFKTLKKEYVTTLIRDWITVEKIKDMCEGDYITILFFYSNQNCDQCKDQGIVLTYLKDALKEDVMIFALDTDLELATVNALKESYGVNTFPSIVVENKGYYGYTSLEELTDLLCDYNSNLTIC